LEPAEEAMMNDCVIFLKVLLMSSMGEVWKRASRPPSSLCARALAAYLIFHKTIVASRSYFGTRGRENLSTTRYWNCERQTEACCFEENQSRPNTNTPPLTPTAPNPQPPQLSYWASNLLYSISKGLEISRSHG
jgi:hypothetical protein